MSTEAMKLALEALEGSTDKTLSIRAVIALREALAQPQQEPVGRLESDPYEGHVFVPRIDGDWSMLGENLYTSPPARKPLTDEEIETVWRSVQANDFHDCVKPFARAIEAAHGIKGEA